MTSASDLAVIRRAYARQIVHKAGSRDPRLEAAFAVIPRETFIGPGPWKLMGFPEADLETPDDDPTFLYQDSPVSLLAAKGLNNGQPSFLAMLIELCGIKDGDRVVHIGTGTGYYTAVISRLAGSKGDVLGLECEADLARRAEQNLGNFTNTRIVVGDGWTYALASADAILVNAGTPRLAVTWLDALRPGGRLVVPLASKIEQNGRPVTRGAIFLITRDDEGYAASCRMGTMIYPCQGGTEPDAEAALAVALAKANAAKVTRLRRERDIEDARCWLRGKGWNLTFD